MYHVPILINVIFPLQDVLLRIEQKLEVIETKFNELPAKKTSSKVPADPVSNRIVVSFNSYQLKEMLYPLEPTYF